MISYEEHQKNLVDFDFYCNDTSHNSWCAFICDRYGFDRIQEYNVDTDPSDDGYDYDKYH